MAVIPQYPIPVDTLPAEVGDAYSNLLDWLTDWLTNSPFEDSPNLIDYFEQDLAACNTPEIRLRYLGRLNLQGGINREPYPRAAAHLQLMQEQVDVWRPENYYALDPFYPHHEREPFSANHFYGWLAVRLLEGVCALIGNSSLRGARQNLWAEWEAVQSASQRYQVEDENAAQLFRYLFGVLVPFANGSRTRSVGSVAEQFRQLVPRQPAGPRPPVPPPEPLPQTLRMLCQNGLTPANVRELLVQLGAVDTETGRWHLGDLTGRPAEMKSTFPAVYRALADLKLLKKLEGPVWLKIFIAEFDVKLSSRMGNYDTKGQVSKKFHEAYDETVRWVKLWRARQEAEQ